MGGRCSDPLLDLLLIIDSIQTISNVEGECVCQGRSAIGPQKRNTPQTKTLCWALAGECQP